MKKFNYKIQIDKLSCKMMKHLTCIFFLIAFSIMLLASCNFSQNESLENENEQTIEQTAEQSLDELISEYLHSSKDLLTQANKEITKFQADNNQENFDALFQILKSLKVSFEYPDDLKLSDAQEKDIEKQQNEIVTMREKIINLLSPYAADYFVTLLDKNDYMLKETTTFPIYACKNSKIFINLSLSNTTCKIYNRDNHALLKQYVNKKNIVDSLVVTNSAIFIIEFTPKGHQYIDANITNRMSSKKDLEFACPIKVTRVESHPGAFKVEKCSGIQIDPIFYEPQKITLAKSTWSSNGPERTIIAMKIPDKCENVLYSLSIRTNEKDYVESGSFCDKVDRTYKKVKFLGLPIYESETAKSSLFRELLNFSHPVREEDAYCDMYVFTNEKEAKKFQEGADVSTLNYSMDLSKKGTQSRNDRIPTKGVKTLYFGFENTIKKYNMYLWLESLGTISKTEYYKTTYELDK